MLDAIKVVFVDVDTQRDFCEPDGSLRVKGAPVDAFRRLTALAVEKKIPVVGSVDAHDFNDIEFDTFPAHCVRGTEGQLKVEGTLPERSRFVKKETQHDLCVLAEALDGGAAQAVFIEKKDFSLFSNPCAADLLGFLGRKTAVVYGVATEYCVKAAVLGLCERGFEVLVVTDAIAGVTPTDDVEARHEMVKAGAAFIWYKELVAALS